MGLFRRRERDELRTLEAPNIAPGYAATGNVYPSTALAIADAYACVRAIADAGASVPLEMYRRTATGDRSRVTGGRTYELLERPSPWATQSQLVGQILAHLNLYGNAYLGKYRDGDGELAQLGALHPDTVRPEIRAGQLVFHHTPPNGPVQDLSTADVLHIRALTTDGLLGLSPIRQAATVLGLSKRLAEHAAVFFDNDARPAGILKLQRFGDTDAAVGELRSAFEAQHQGQPHRIAVIAGDVDFEQLGMPMDDAQFLDQRKLSAVEVARIFRVPPWMIGADSGESMTYSNTESQSLAFVTYSLRPWLVAIEQAVTADPDLCSRPSYVEFKLDALLRADSRTRSEVYARALDPITGWMTRGEVRRLENLEPETGEPAVAVATLAELAGAIQPVSTNGVG